MKSAERQAALVDHKTREFLVRQQTQTVNAIRAHLSEFGIVVPKGIQNVDRLQVAAGEVPEAARPALDLLAAQLHDTRARIADVTKRIEAAQAEDALARRLAAIPGIGALTASALAATTPEVDAFRSARDYAAWLGLTPKPHSTGGKERLARISKAGNRYLRRLLFLGASCRRHASGVTARISACRGRKPGEDWRSPSPSLLEPMAQRWQLLEPMAHNGSPDAAEKTREGRRHCAGQPHGADGLGADQDRRQLQGQPGLTERAGPRRPATRR